MIWQGRYGLPFAAGLTLISGLALDGGHPRTAGRGAASCHRLCLTCDGARGGHRGHLLAREMANSVSLADSAWLAPHAAPLVTTLVVAAWLVWTFALSTADSSVPPASRPPDAPNHDASASGRSRTCLATVAAPTTSLLI